MYYVIKNEFAKAGNVLKQTDVYKSFNISPDFLMNQINSEIGLYHNDLYLPESIFTIINLDKERFRGYTKKIIPSFDELTRFLVSMAEFFMITNSNEEFKKIYSLLITNFPVYKEIEALKAKHIYLSIYSQFGKKISELNSIEELEKIDTLIKQMPIFERNVYLERITDEYKINLSNIDSMTIECIITGDYVFDTLKRNEHKMDYASAAICWCRAAEKEIKDKLITPLLVSNDTKTKEIIAKAKLPKAVTLGTLSQITGISHDKQVEIDRAKYIFECVISKDFLFNSEAFIKLCVYIDTLRHNFRNVVSHPEEITLVRAEECRKIILGINKILHIISNNYIPEKNLQA